LKENVEIVRQDIEDMVIEVQTPTFFFICVSFQ